MFRVLKLKDLLKLDKISTAKHGGTIFQNPNFLNYHGEKFKNIVLAYFKENDLIAYITLSLEKNIAYSHKGASYGGFVQLKKIHTSNLEKIIDDFFLELKKLKIKKFFVRFPPDLFLDTEYNSLNKELKNKTTLNFKEETTYIDLDNYTFKDLKKSGFRRNHIRDINQFSKNSKIQIDKVDNLSHLKEYYEILKNNLTKFNTKPTHKIEELEYLIFELPSSIKISLLSVESVFVAGMTKFRLNKNALHIFYGSMDYKYLNEFPGALKFLYNHEINNAKNKGYRYFNFGVDVHHGEKPNINLRNFKLGFGGKITTRDSYFKDL